MFPNPFSWKEWKNKNLPFLLVSVIFALIPVSAARPMTSLFAQHLGASMFEIGIITACYSLAPLLLALTAGRLVDRYGEKLPIFFGSMGIMASLALPFFSPSVMALYALQLILGASQLFVLVAIQNGVAKSSGAEGRDRAVGSLSLSASVGMLLGPLIGGYITEHFGFQTSYFLLSLNPIVPMIIALLILKPTLSAEFPEAKQAGQFRDLLFIPGLGKSIFVSMVTLSALDIFNVYYPLFAKSVGLSLSEIGWILAIQAAANAVVRIFMPRLVLRFGRVQILSAFMLIGAVAYGLITFFHQFLLVVLIATVLGMGLGVAQPMTIILSYNAAPNGRTGEVLGLRLAANRLAQTFIPFLLANLSNFVGLGVIFTAKALILGLGGWIAGRITDQESKRHFVDKPVETGKSTRV